jgi:hypothetical protein
MRSPLSPSLAQLLENRHLNVWLAALSVLGKLDKAMDCSKIADGLLALAVWQWF